MCIRDRYNVPMDWYYWVILALLLLIVVLLYLLWVRSTRKGTREWVYITDSEVRMLQLPAKPKHPSVTVDCEGGEKHTLFLVNGDELKILKDRAGHKGIELEGTGVMCYPPSLKSAMTRKMIPGLENPKYKHKKLNRMDWKEIQKKLGAKGREADTFAGQYTYPNGVNILGQGMVPGRNDLQIKKNSDGEEYYEEVWNSDLQSKEQKDAQKEAYMMYRDEARISEKLEGDNWDDDDFVFGF